MNFPFTFIGVKPPGIFILFSKCRIDNTVRVPFHEHVLYIFQKTFDVKWFLLYIPYIRKFLPKAFYDKVFRRVFPLNNCYFIVQKGRKKRDARQNLKKITKGFCDK